MKELKLRFDHGHVKQVNQVAEIVHCEPNGQVFWSLVGEGSAEGDAPAIVAIAERD